MIYIACNKTCSMYVHRVFMKYKMQSQNPLYNTMFLTLKVTNVIFLIVASVEQQKRQIIAKAQNNLKDDEKVIYQLYFACRLLSLEICVQKYSQVCQKLYFPVSKLSQYILNFHSCYHYNLNIWNVCNWEIIAYYNILLETCKHLGKSSMSSNWNFVPCGFKQPCHL